MALNAAVDWNVRPSGSTNNGGGFNRGASGVDRSQQDAAHATLTTASTVHTTTTQINVAVGDYTVTANDVGNLVNVTGGSATAGTYEITAADVPNNRWTVDRSVGTAGQTVAGAMGGGKALIANLTALVVPGNRVAIQNASSYAVTTTTTLSISGNSGNPIQYFGYNATYGDSGRATITTATSSIILLSATGTQQRFRNLIFEATGSPSSTRGLSIDGNTSMAENCTATGPFVSGFRLQTVSARAINCTATAHTSGANPFQLTTGAGLIYCQSYSNASLGFTVTAGRAFFLRCIAANNSGASSDGFQLASTSGADLYNCVSYNNGRDGVRFSGAGTGDGATIRNSIFVLNAGYGINSSTTAYTVAGSIDLDYNAFYSNTSGARNNVLTGASDVTLTGDPFTNGGANDFSLNDTAGAGAACRAVGFPGALTLGTGYLDLGALQHQDPAGGSGGGLRLAGRGGLAVGA